MVAQRELIKEAKLEQKENRSQVSQYQRMGDNMEWGEVSMNTDVGLKLNEGLREVTR